ncbi:isochorismatase family cysteine hydrolase [Mycoplasma sp. 1781]
MNKIIFVIDMLNGFCNKGKMASIHINNLIPKIEKYLFKNKNEKMLFVCDSHKENDVEMQSYPLHCLEETWEAEIVDELKPYVTDVIKKNSTNAFFAFVKSGLIDLIYKYDVFEILGCCTDICILQFALTLKTYLNFKGLDKEIIIYKELVDTFENENHSRKAYHDFALELMKNSGIKIK